MPLNLNPPKVGFVNPRARKMSLPYILTPIPPVTPVQIEACLFATKPVAAVLALILGYKE
jgi:hypothetical protein